MVSSINEILALGYPVELDFFKAIINTYNITYDKCPKLKELINSINYSYKKGMDGYIEYTELSKVEEAKSLINEYYLNDIKEVFNIEEFEELNIELSMNFPCISLNAVCLDGMFIGLTFSFKEIMNLQCGYADNDNYDKFINALNNNFKDLKNPLIKLSNKIK